jgi:hypothetical protein
VCDLCAPRAAHEGWQREADQHAVSIPPLRARRGRNLFERLRQLGRPAEASPDAAVVSASYDREPEPYDFLGGSAPVAPLPVPAVPADRSGARAARPAAGPRDAEGADIDGHTLGLSHGTSAAAQVERAIEVFNMGEAPRRIASLARSLDAPDVSVRCDEDLENVVAIVVAWELCWYHYRVDLDDELPEARVIAQGTELDELARVDRLANAVTDELGALSLIGAHT